MYLSIDSDLKSMFKSLDVTIIKELIPLVLAPGGNKRTSNKRFFFVTKQFLGVDPPY